MSVWEQKAKKQMDALMATLAETDRLRQGLARAQSGEPITMLDRIIEAIASTMVLPSDSWIVGQTARAVLGVIDAADAKNRNPG